MQWQQIVNKHHLIQNKINEDWGVETIYAENKDLLKMLEQYFSQPHAKENIEVIMEELQQLIAQQELLTKELSKKQ